MDGTGGMGWLLLVIMDHSHPSPTFSTSKYLGMETYEKTMGVIELYRLALVEYCGSFGMWDKYG